MKVLGNRVYLLLPQLPETKIELSPATKKQLEEEMVGKYDKLEVLAIGEGVNNSAVAGATNPLVKVGDTVMVDPMGLKRGVVFELEDKKVIAVAYYDILHVW
jgi:co-chaperonin GroES (HSP10)